MILGFKLFQGSTKRVIYIIVGDTSQPHNGDMIGQPHQLSGGQTKAPPETDES